MLPRDSSDAVLIGRVLTEAGPTPVRIRGARVEDISRVGPTVSQILEALEPGVDPPAGEDLGPLVRFLPNPGAPNPGSNDAARGRLLTPIDLQCIKAAGVTFAASALERVIEERCRGDAALAATFRDEIQRTIGADLKTVSPGSQAAAKLKSVLIAEGVWSQYLEVAIGPYAEVFTKAPVLSAVGWGQEIGVRSDSGWNNPEPEIVLVCDAQGRPRGATLGNDVNLRDIEGRSALLLGKAKDNNASCAVGPFIRLFDDRFTLDDVRSAVVSLHIEGGDGFRLEGASSMTEISRDPLDLIGQTIGDSHQYPDGFVLFLGTMFAPTQDREDAGRGFTHKPGDIVRISSPRLGVLENRVTLCEAAPPWTFGIAALMRNLAGRGLL